MHTLYGRNGFFARETFKFAAKMQILRIASARFNIAEQYLPPPFPTAEKPPRITQAGGDGIIRASGYFRRQICRAMLLRIPLP